MTEINQGHRIWIRLGGGRNLGSNVMSVGRGIFEKVRLFKAPVADCALVSGFAGKQQLILLERAAREAHVINQAVPNLMLFRVASADDERQVGLMIGGDLVRHARSLD